MLSGCSRYGFIVFAFALAASLWVLEAFVHVVAFSGGSFLDQLIEPDSNELWMRCMIAGLVIGFGICVQAVFNRQQRQCGMLQQAERRLTDANIRLESTTDLLQDILESIPVRVFWKDRNCCFLGCNTSFAVDAGFSGADELVGKCDPEIAWHEQAERYRADDRAVMESGEPKLAYEEPQTTPDGRTVWRRTSKVPLQDREGGIIGILGIYDDITEQKQMNRMFQTAIESMVEVSGREFFQQLVRSLCGFLGAECAIVGEVSNGRVRTLAVQVDGKLVDELEYDLLDTPCGRAVSEGYCLYRERVCERFPDNKNLIRMGAEAYVGMPIRGRHGECVGILCAISRHKLAVSEQTRGLFDIMAARAAAEIESMRIMENRGQLLDQNRLLTRKLLSAQEVERRKLARDLHDEIGQTLTALRAHMTMAKKYSRESGSCSRSRGERMSSTICSRWFTPCWKVFNPHRSTNWDCAGR